MPKQLFNPNLQIGQEIDNLTLTSIFHCSNMGGIVQFGKVGRKQFNEKVRVEKGLIEKVWSYSKNSLALIMID